MAPVETLSSWFLKIYTVRQKVSPNNIDAQRSLGGHSITSVTILAAPCNYIVTFRNYLLIINS